MDKLFYTIEGLQFSTGDVILEYSYFISAILFVIGLKYQSSPATARKGNLWASAGMILAVVITLILHKDDAGRGIKAINMLVILGVILIGSVIGSIIARKVKMTAMPQMVSFYNATGGAASALVAFTEFYNPANDQMLVTLLGLFVGIVTFSGSLVAYGKLDGKIKDIYSYIMTYVNLFILALIVFGIVFILVPGTEPYHNLTFILLTVISLVYGVTFVIPIGGADMPVVISLLNSLSGIAAALAGFIYHNQAMILGGILVGAAGTILTILMCNAMNRSLLNVLVGAFGGGGAGAEGKDVGTIKEISLADAAVLLSYTNKVVIVPGYGLAAAQAQHLCSDLDKLLTDKGVNVKYAIHPVAGRMPGHMNVLLAEADVPYDKLVEMETINPEMPNTDVTLIIGANDVVNPAAIDDPSSPIYGMPIINAHESRNIIVLKRGMGKGYAAIENFLFFNNKTRMLFGNAKETLQKLVTEVKSI